METDYASFEQNPAAVTREKIKEDLRTLVRDAEGLLKATAQDMSEKAAQARLRLSAALEKAKITCQKMEEKTVEAAKATDRVIREHPYESIGVAFGLGLLIGVLVSRK